MGIYDMRLEPGFWMYEVSGRLRPVIEDYLHGKDLTPDQIAMMRAYLRQWINAFGFFGPAIEDLRRRVDGLISQDAIDAWIADAVTAGADPL